MSVQDSILSSIKLRTSKNPIMSFELEKSYGIPGTEVRNIIRALRRDGYPIAHCSVGYYYARTSDEIDSTASDLENRAKSLFETASKMRSYFNRNLQKQEGSLFDA